MVSGRIYTVTSQLRIVTVLIHCSETIFSLMTKPPVAFPALLRALAAHHSFCPALETLFFRHSLLDCWFHPSPDQSVSIDPDPATVKLALDRLADSHPLDTVCLYSTSDTEGVRTLKELRTASDRRLFAERIRRVQVLPPGYEHKRIHCLDLKFVHKAYECGYTLKEENRVKECTNDRWFLKLKEVSMRVIREVEAATGLRLTQCQMAFVMPEGRCVLQSIASCVLVPESALLAEGLCTPPMSPRVASPRQSPDSSLNSPLRIRTPAYTCPSSPQHSLSSRDESHRSPLASPVRFFGLNFKEMIAKSVEKGRRLREVGRSRPKVDIDEVVKDDETFFQYVGVSENHEVTPSKARLGLSVSTDHCTSTASTHTSSPLLIPKQLIRLLKPLQAKLLFPKPPAHP